MRTTILLDFFFLLYFEYLYYQLKTWLWEIIILMLPSILVRILTCICKNYCLLCPPFSGSLTCGNSEDSTHTHAMTYYSEIMQSKISKGKSAWGEVWGNQALAPMSSLPVESHALHLISQQRVSQHMTPYLPGKLIRDSVTGDFIEG